MIPRFPVYLFDVDGTLLDSAPDIVASVRTVFARHDRPAPSEETLRGRVGRHLYSTFQEEFPDFSGSQIAELIELYRITYRARNHQSTRVFPSVAAALSSLSGRKATATTKSTPTTRLVLDHFGLLPYFDHVQGTDGFPAKPEPDVLHRAIEALGARPEDCLLVGDSPVDVEAGKRAGIPVCAVRYGYGRHLIATGAPDYWVDDLRELVA